MPNARPPIHSSHLAERAAECLSELLETIPDAEVALLDVLSAAHEQDLAGILRDLLAATSGLTTSALDQASRVSDGICRALADPRPGLGGLHRALLQLHEWACRGIAPEDELSLIRIANGLPDNLDQAYHDAIELLNDLPKPRTASVSSRTAANDQLLVGSGSILVNYVGAA